MRAAGDGPAEVDVVPARLEGAEAWIAAAAGRPAPDLVFPNHGDHGYARVLLPLRWPPCRTSSVGSTTHSCASSWWGTLWEMIRSARYSSLAFLELVRTDLPAERDDQILLAALDAARGARPATRPPSGEWTRRAAS